MSSCIAPSSSGQGYKALDLGTAVRIRQGLLIMTKLESFLFEVRRKIIHVSGLLALIPLIYLDEKSATIAFGIFVLIAWFVHWYWDRRSLREKYLKKITEELPEEHRHNILQGANQIKKFEEEVLFGFMKYVKRKKEREPMLAPFYYLLSTFVAVVLLGPKFAIFGLLAIGIGDTFAAILGKKFGKHKLPYNKEKSFEGWAAFFASTAFAIFVFVNIFPQYAIINPLLLAIISGFVGAMIETIPTVNDNSIIPFGVGLAIWLVVLF